jgi:hypothetical protein
VDERTVPAGHVRVAEHLRHDVGRLFGIEGGDRLRWEVLEELG